MGKEINRREFLEVAAAGGALYLGGSDILASGKRHSMGEALLDIVGDMGNPRMCTVPATRAEA